MGHLLSKHYFYSIYIILVMREKVLHIQSMFTLDLNDLNMCEISILNKTQTATVKRMLGNKVFLHTYVLTSIFRSDH